MENISEDAPVKNWLSCVNWVLFCRKIHLWTFIYFKCEKLISQFVCLKDLVSITWFSKFELDWHSIVSLLSSATADFQSSIYILHLTVVIEVTLWWFIDINNQFLHHQWIWKHLIRPKKLMNLARLINLLFRFTLIIISLHCQIENISTCKWTMMLYVCKYAP